MSLRIGNALLIDQIGREDWEDFAMECGFTKAFVRRRLRSIVEALGEALPSVIDSVLEEHSVAEHAAEAVMSGVAAQVRMVSGSVRLKRPDPRMSHLVRPQPAS